MKLEFKRFCVTSEIFSMKNSIKGKREAWGIIVFKIMYWGRLKTNMYKINRFNYFHSGTGMFSLDFNRQG